MVKAVFYYAGSGDYIRFRDQPNDIYDILHIIATACMGPSDCVWLIPGMEG